MVILKFFKVTSVPVSWVANSLYFVENGDYAEIYLTSSTGVPKLVGNSEMIGELTTHINAGTF